MLVQPEKSYFPAAQVEALQLVKDLPVSFDPITREETQFMNKLKYLGSLILIVLGATSIYAQGAENDVAITLERGACFGACPVYTLNILDDGTVIYEGEQFVAVTGQQISEIPSETVEAMVTAFENVGYFDWNEAYDTQTISDLPTMITSVTLDGTTHRIVRYAGDNSAPLALSFLEQWIDEIANTSAWTGIEPDISAISNGVDTPLITLRRTQNFGAGVVYSVAAYDDGTIIYTGIANVSVIGVQVLETDATAIKGVAQSAQIFGYFDWQDRYEARVITDQATVSTSVRWEDQFKRIVRYDGDPNAPIGLIRIEDSIKRLVADFVGEEIG